MCASIPWVEDLGLVVQNRFRRKLVIRYSVVPSKNKSLGIPRVLFAFEGEEGFANEKGADASRLRKALEQEGFKGKESEGTWAQGSQVVAVGLGKREPCRVESYRRAGGRAARLARSVRATSVSVDWPNRGLKGDLFFTAKAFAEGLSLGAYQFNRYRTQKEELAPALDQVTFHTDSGTVARMKQAVETASNYTEGVVLARDLINGGPSDVTPRVLVETAKRIASKTPGVTVKIFGKKELEKMGAGGLLGVNRGSAEEPFLIHLHYRPKKASSKSLALVGKGITFDSGGLSLKPAASMETMKCDMSGAAAVLGAFSQIGKVAPRAEVHGIIATTENMPGSRATKPGDVLKALNGKTMEVLNTDAEGRLILADALSYAVNQKVDAIVDMATLTGACVIALGALVTGALGNDEAFMGKVKVATQAEGEMVWEMPLIPEYRADIRSKIADMKNIGGNREAGTIIGGLFLKEFVGDTPWVHLDIAGPAWLDRDFPALPYTYPGGTGLMVRSLLTLVKSF
jgi:leucyl aminopeptidase